MKLLKIITLIGTRPEIIKLSETMRRLDSACDHVIVHTGQNYDYELNEVFFKDLELKKPDYFLDAAAETPAESIANVISKFDQVLKNENPDAVLIYGDTNSCMGAISAKKRKIPIFHMEAGNRCFDQRVPEEVNRKIIDHLSDINIVHSEHARAFLIKEGLRPDMILKSGSPMNEILKIHKSKISSSKIIETLQLKKSEYFLVSLHREENVDDENKLRGLVSSLKRLNAEYHMKVVVSTHPRTRNRLEKLNILSDDQGILFLKPFGFFDYLQLQINAKCTLSDSGTITEESSMLGFPAVMLRETHERPEGMDEAAVLMSGLNEESILRCVSLSIQHKPSEQIRDYVSENVSEKVVRWIHSYTAYVNRVVWMKEAK